MIVKLLSVIVCLAVFPSGARAANQKSSSAEYKNVILAILDGSSGPEISKMIAGGRLPSISGVVKSGGRVQLRPDGKTGRKSIWNEILKGKSSERTHKGTSAGTAMVFQQVKAAKKGLRTLLVSDDPAPFISRHHRKTEQKIRSEMRDSLDVIDQKAPFTLIAERAQAGLKIAAEQPFYALLDFNLTTGENKYDHLDPREHERRIVSADHEIGQLMDYVRKCKMEHSTAVFILILNPLDSHEHTMLLLSNIANLKPAGELHALAVTTLDALGIEYESQGIKNSGDSLLPD